MRKNKTIHNAVENLDKETANKILEIWRECNVMDLYDGKLVSYLVIIKQIIQRLKLNLIEKENLIQEIREKIHSLQNSL